MSVPRDRVSYGAHVFPFVGLGGVGPALPAVPFLPVRVRVPGGAWCVPFNAVLDTGSTHSVLPHAIAQDVGIEVPEPSSSMEGAAADFETSSAACDLAIVDASLPDVHCWEVGSLDIRIAAPGTKLKRPVVGWDVLGLFDLSISQSRDRIEMRLAATGTKQERVVRTKRA